MAGVIECGGQMMFVWRRGGQLKRSMCGGSNPRCPPAIQALVIHRAPNKYGVHCIRATAPVLRTAYPCIVRCAAAKYIQYTIQFYVL